MNPTAPLFTCSTDDGHPSDMKMAALLDKHGLRGTFFIPIRNREGMDVMPPSQMRELAQRFEIGSHTADHCFLDSVDMVQARFQVAQGKKILEDILGNRVAGFCYPGGKYRRQHAALVQATAFRYARTTMNLCFDAGENRFEMPTTCQFYPHRRSVYVRNFIRMRRWRKRRPGLALALAQSNWIARLYALFDYACDQRAVFHLWAHSHDIDELDAWHELDGFLAHVASRVTPPGRLNNEQLAARFFPF